MGTLTDEEDIREAFFSNFTREQASIILNASLNRSPGEVLQEIENEYFRRVNLEWIRRQRLRGEKKEKVKEVMKHCLFVFRTKQIFFSNFWNVELLIISGLFSWVQNNRLFTGYSYKTELYDGGILEISEI